MKIQYRQAVMLVLLWIASSMMVYAQWLAPRPGPPTRPKPHAASTQALKAGLNVVVSIDSFSIRLGLDAANIQFIAEQGVRSAGWEVKPSSMRRIEIAIDSLGKFYSDSCTVRINVSGTEKFLNTTRFDAAQFNAILNRMVYAAALQIRKDIMENNPEESEQDNPDNRLDQLERLM
jgi:hypothetical protein